MGFYIQAPFGPKGKAKYLHEHHGAEIMLSPKFPTDENIVAVCIVDNGPFEAAGIAYDKNEFDVFNEPTDPRQKTWVNITKKKAIELCPEVKRYLG